MTIQSTTALEFRTTGDNTNGGAFDSGISGAGTDYTLQDSAQLTLTDIASTTGTSVLTSATGGFTAAMVGNAIQISSGTNFTAGFYFIVTYTNTNTVTVDRDPTTGSNGSSGSGKLGGALDTPTDTILEQFVAGTIFWLKYGTFALTESISMSLTGTPANMCKIIGYNTTRGDKPTGSNRPTIAAGSNSFRVNYCWTVQNIILTTEETSGLAGPTADGDGFFLNCKANNSYSSGGRYAFYLRDMRCIQCEGISNDGYAFGVIDGPSDIWYCYAHDSNTGFLSDGSTDIMNCTNCVADTCTIGVDLGLFSSFVNGVVYNCTTGISLDEGTSGTCTIISNIISDCTTGVSADADYENNVGFYNLYYNNTSDTSNFTKGDNNVSGNPNFSDPSNGDFTCSSGGAALNAGVDYANVGLTGAYKLNIGVDQDDNAAGGGGGAFAFTYIN